MYCEKCGSELLEIANFCENCGTQVNNNKEILLKVKPSFKFIYLSVDRIIKPLIYFIIFLIITMSTVNYGVDQANKLDPANLLSIFDFLPLLIILIGIPLAGLIVSIIKMFILKKQYENSEFIFYNDRVVYKDGYLNISEKELKYINIKEITKRQTFIQRFFNIGNIILFSSAENEFSNGIYMTNIGNVDDVYTKLKEIINV